MQINEVYQFVNCGLDDAKKINNVSDLASHLLPDVQIAVVNSNKLKSFLFSLNLALYDLKMIKDLIELHGKYEAFNCYRRVIVKFAINICQLANNSDYLSFEKASSVSVRSGSSQSELVKRLMIELDPDDDAFTNLFF